MAFVARVEGSGRAVGPYARMASPNTHAVLTGPRHTGALTAMKYGRSMNECSRPSDSSFVYRIAELSSTLRPSASP